MHQTNLWYWENEKCSECQDIEGRENECLTCNEGYYLSLNEPNENNCTKCSIDGCKICHNITSVCQECKNNYESIIDNNGIITACILKCDLGGKNKCLTCSLEEGKENQCGSCNSGYKLMKNGTCLKIENSFIGIYRITTTSDYSQIMNLDKNNITLSDFDMYLNGKQVFPFITYGGLYWYEDYFVSYKFPSLGLQEVKIIFNRTLTNMHHLFWFCSDLVSINFHETFDTSKVQCMEYMFVQLPLLKSINLSSFNTSFVTNFGSIFSGCDELTSLDLSNFQGTNSYYIERMIVGCKKLMYIDLSSFYSPFSEQSFYISNVASNGTLIINKKLKYRDIPNNWKIIYKDWKIFHLLIK